MNEIIRKVRGKRKDMKKVRRTKKIFQVFIQKNSFQSMNKDFRKMKFPMKTLRKKNSFMNKDRNRNRKNNSHKKIASLIYKNRKNKRIKKVHNLMKKKKYK